MNMHVKTEGKFKVGDRVRFTDKVPTAYWFGPHTEYKNGTINGGYDDYWDVATADGVGVGLSNDSLVLVATPSPAIVAKLDNGQPNPATRPYVHADTASATAEAERLAMLNKGQEFGVYELVATRKEERVYEHEWQRLAAGGDRDGAAELLHALTGMHHSDARMVAARYA